MKGVISFRLVRRKGIFPVMPSFFLLSPPPPPPSLMFLLPFPLSPNMLLQGKERAGGQRPRSLSLQ